MTEKRGIWFARDFSDQEFKVFEVTEEILNEIKTDGNKIAIRGEDEDGAVFCTAKETFEIQLVETSNCCLLLNPDKNLSQEQPFIIEGKFHNIYELVPTKPRISKLANLLHKNSYKGPEETQSLVTPLTYEHLLSVIQASQAQLDEALESLDVLSIDGNFRTIDSSYGCEVLDLILSACIENDWSLESVPEAGCASHLSAMFPEYVTRAVLYSHSAEPMRCIGLYF
eukprot:c4043_g1_i1.p1 GENE.c4043_g1_i1~~c4043_g1_i1.p1  ORF type:complete len:242 (+),score=76.53 c4043_g1_i1:49-726(+)